ncbi:MAG: ABC-2 transporter permease [Lachnospiraceae bacterium]|nr:ABC-2 transporter permease [Lachnospiraceae bacterium]
MRNIMLKEMKLSASLLSYLFILSGLMFFLPGYPVLCGAFFSALGLYKSFEFAREANDTLFSALLPIAKKDVVKGKYAFVCVIEFCTLFLMVVCVIVRMTILKEAPVYHDNALMNANCFALGAAFFLFGLFNLIFVGGFFKTAYKLGRPFLVYMIAAFLSIGVFEALHHIPGLEVLNAFGTENIKIQLLLLMAGIAAWILMTVFSCRKACICFEKIDL